MGFVTIAGAIPGVALSISGVHITPVAAELLYVLAFVGVSFLLSWGAEVAQHNIPQALALTLLA